MTWRRTLAGAATATVVLLLGGCFVLVNSIEWEDRPHGINVDNPTEHIVTIYYDNPELSSGYTPEQIERLNTRAVLDPGTHGSFMLLGSPCAAVDIVALDEDDNVIDRLPAGTCHDDETIDWTIEDPG